MLNHLRRFGRRAPRGQGLVEMAIILPVLMLVLLLALDFGRVFFGWVGLTNASRIGASYAAAHPDAWGTPGSAIERDHYNDQILADASALNCVLPGTLPAPVFPNGTDLGDPAQVTLTCQFSLITPLVSQILGGMVTIRAESIFPVRAGMIDGVPVQPGTVPPAPSGALCQNPGFTGYPVGHANNPDPTIQTRWAAEGFTTTVIVTRPPNNNYDVQKEGPLVGGQWGSCDTVLTVGP